MQLSRLIMLSGVAVLCAGCATTPVYVRNAQTGEIAKCGPYTNMHPLFPAMSPHWQAERDCISDFQRQGFERMAQPPKD